MEQPPPKKKQRSECRRLHCPHCSRNLSYSAYWSHKAKYFNCDTNTWLLQSESLDINQNVSFEEDEEGDLSVDINHIINFEGDELEHIQNDVSYVDGVPNSSSEDESICDGSSDDQYQDIELLSSDSDTHDNSVTLEGGPSNEAINDQIGEVPNDVRSDQSQDIGKYWQLVRFISLFVMKLQLLHKLSDSVITTLLKFLKVLLSFLGSLMPNSSLSELLNILPQSLYYTRKYAQLNKTTQYKPYSLSKM